MDAIHTARQIVTLRTARRISAAAATAGWTAVVALAIPALGRPSLRLVAALVVSGSVAATGTVVRAVNGLSARQADAIDGLSARHAEEMSWAVRLGADVADAHPWPGGPDQAASAGASMR